jgi:hypothetical protein
MPQMMLANYDHMIQALTSNRADQSFGIAVLPRRSRRCRSVANAHRANAPRKCLAIDTVAISNQIGRLSLLYWGGLLSSAFRLFSIDPVVMSVAGSALLFGIGTKALP